jgi:hypothetical protein
LLVSAAEGVRLSSVIYPAIWPAGRELIAACRRRRQLPRKLASEGSHAAPEAACQCGIYGATYLTLLRPYLERHATEPEAGAQLLGRVLGRVRLWGTVVECSQGWRASHAYPARIYVSSGAHKAQLLEGEQLAWSLAVYGVPLELVACQNLADLAAALAQEPELA